MFNDIRDQIMAGRIRVKHGTIQDATFIGSDRGKIRETGGERMQKQEDPEMEH